MLTIAGGILLAVLILILLPWLLAGAAWVAGLALVIAIAGGAIWALWTGAQSVEGLAAKLVIGAVFLALFLPWLYFERKLKREKATRDLSPVGEHGEQLPPSWRTDRTGRKVRR